MDDETQNILGSVYDLRESYPITKAFFSDLHQRGLKPEYAVVDGHKSVLRALHEVWPKLVVQRCLYHIQREGMRWLRTYPKTSAGKELRHLLNTITSIKTIQDRNLFDDRFQEWQNKHASFIKNLPSSDIAFKDLKKTRSLIINARPNMFHYLEEKNLSSTTNKLEGFFSRLKADYRAHRGMNLPHRIAYLKWYCSLKNTPL